MVEKKNKINSFSLRLDTITPVAVGNGDGLSPYTDFVFDRDDILIIDKDKLAWEISEKDAGGNRLMNEYVDNIYSGMNNNRSRFNLKNFIESKQKVGVELADVTFPNRKHSYFGLNPNIRQEIKCIVKNGDKPYIPGSSIKGAIKGALLYDWLLNAGAKEFEEVIKTIETTYQRCLLELNDIERLGKRDMRDYGIRKIQYRLIQRKTHRDPEGKRVALDRLIKGKIEEFLTEEKLNTPREFFNLKPSDTGLFLEEDLIIQKTDRLHYVKGKAAIPVNTEAIKTDLWVVMKLTLYPQFNQEGLGFLNSDDPLPELFRRINQFSRANIAREIQILETFPGLKIASGWEADLFEDYKKELIKIQGFLQSADEDVAAYFPIGFGKSFYYNSIGLAVFHESDERKKDNGRISLFQKYCKLYFMGNPGQKDFPLTRPVTDIGEPLGWVKLSRR